MAGRTQRVSDLSGESLAGVLTPPVEVLPAVEPRAPVVFASAHSGQIYPPGFVAASRLGPQGLRRSEDSFVDELFAAAPSLGAPLVRARFARAFCDANREKWELDPAMFAERLPDWVNAHSPRVAVGLGTVAKVVSSGEAIYRDKLAFSEVVARIEFCWQGFHDALDAQIRQTQARFGVALLLDCHSMPGSSQTRGERADIILGDAHGTACAPALIQQAEMRLRDLGFRVRRNDPYAGGYITRHYGRPREGVHALQIEVCRSLYMKEADYTKSVHFQDVQSRLERFAAQIVLHAASLAA